MKWVALPCRETLLGWLAVVVTAFIGIDQWPVAAQTNHILDGDLIVFPSVALSAIHPLFPFLLKRGATGGGDAPARARSIIN